MLSLESFFSKFFKKKNLTGQTAMINLILFGPPGSGKGTQAAQLVEKYNLLHISTGDLFRSEIGNKTALGIEAKSYMDKGALVPDEVTINMLKKKVKENPDVKGYIFDGFPRTIPQAEALDTMLMADGQAITSLVTLNVDDEEIVARLLNRAKTSGRSDDANEGVIRNRLSVYKETTAVVARHYDKKDKTHTINGVGTIDEVFGRLTEVIDRALVAV